MSYSSRLELIYIPSDYWNHSASNFKLIDGKGPIPQSSDFFFLWMFPIRYSENELIDKVKHMFGTIPVEKLRTCQISLAIPSENEYFTVETILGKIMPISPVLKLLYQINIIETQDRSQKHYSDSIKTYAFLTKLLFELLNRGNFAPTLTRQSENVYEGKWKLLLRTQTDNERFSAILKHCPITAHNLPLNFMRESKKESNNKYVADCLWHPSFLFSYYLDAVGDVFIRKILKKTGFQTFKQFYSMEFEKKEDKNFPLPWDFRFLKSIITVDSQFKIRYFHEKIIPKIIKNWVQITQNLDTARNYTLGFQLNYPKNNTEDWPLNLIIQFYDNISVSLKEFLINKLPQGTIAVNIGKKEELIESMFRSLGSASKLFPPIMRALEERIPNQVMLASSEVIEFMRYQKDLLIQSGFSVSLPEVFTMGGKQRLTTRLIIHSKKKESIKSKGYTMPSMFNLNSLIEYEWEATIKGEKLSKSELKRLIEGGEPLINRGGEWILLDQQDVKELTEIFKNDLISGEMNYMEALKLGLSESIQLEEGGNKFDVIVEGDLNEIIEKIKSIDKFEEIPVPESFNGSLRPYQVSGLTWMANMCEYHFGLCLADDMGLGKTIQVIALLQHNKETNQESQKGSVLIICPTSLLFNWEKEFNRFAPDMEVIIHHGPERYKDAKDIPKFLKAHRIFLTTYGTLRNDIDFLETINFNGIIVDEIQNIKNYDSKQTKAVYRLQANYKIGLSGTPIENRLMELWTLFEFLNPGLLGSRTKFQEDFIVPIERYQDKEAIRELKNIISPFILRRLKSDKSIIKDLPDKNEMKIYVGLSEVQAKLYKELIDEALNNLDKVIKDKINVLTLLVKLKQICNHPFQFQKKPVPSFGNGLKLEEFTSQSYKLERLIEMVEEVISNGEKALIFTQFKKMGDIIAAILQEQFKFKVLFFHGGVPEKKRREIVNEFQSSNIHSAPIMILSLKAGGTGLNLTQATTVFHFDRWWNPAVEDQATDRAYRIGQKSPVNVYKFITNGTIEEKIDALLEEKRDLADTIVTATGESWITNLNFEKIKDLFTYEM
ncbi:MAG: DEAD/DEAH box helicase [Promethearchaeota archaeon]|nr:MAG: DEAD/DEAH box helicase [Candidatus Lokiarchaeota archaeon]